MREEKPLIAVDLDDVLFDFIGHFFPWHNRKYGSELQAEDMVYAKIWDAWGGTQAEAVERIPSFWREVDLLALEPIPGSVEALGELKGRFRLRVVSARDAAAEAQTRAWMAHYFSGIFEEVHLGIADPTAPGKRLSKAEMCRRMGAVTLIDDQLVHAREGAAAGIRVLLFGDLPYNQSASLPEGVVRAEDWEAVRQILLGDEAEG